MRSVGGAGSNAWVESAAPSSFVNADLRNCVAVTWNGIDKFLLIGQQLINPAANSDVFWRVATSADGVVWTGISSPSSTRNGRPSGLAYGGGRYVALNFVSAQTREILSSSDGGITWVAASIPSGSGCSDMPYWNTGYKGLIYANGVFVSVASRGASLSAASYCQCQAVYSNSGSSWTGVTTPCVYASCCTTPTCSFNAIAYGSGYFVVVGQCSDPGALNTYGIMRSSNGQSWTLVTGYTSSCEWTAIAYGAGTFIAISRALNRNGPSSCSSTVNIYIISKDAGYSWTTRTFASYYYPTTIAFANGTFVVSYSNALLVSKDLGESWTQV